MPQTVAHHDKSPKNKRNPKPSPIGNNFGFLSFGSHCWARTSDIMINSHALVSPPSHSRVLSPRYTRLGSLLACRMLCILGGFAAYKTTLSCFVLATTSLRSIRKARNRLSRHPSSEASIISQTKKPPEIGWFFVWLPLLGSNQRHHD